MGREGGVGWDGMGWAHPFPSPVGADVQLSQLEIAILTPRAATEHQQLFRGAIAVGRVQRGSVAESCGGAMSTVDGIVPGQCREASATADLSASAEGESKAGCCATRPTRPTRPWRETLVGTLVKTPVRPLDRIVVFLAVHDGLYDDDLRGR